MIKYASIHLAFCETSSVGCMCCYYHRVSRLCIIIYRDNVDTHHTIIQKSKLCNNIPVEFLWPARLLVACKCIAYVPNQKVAKWPKLVFFFRWASSNLCDSFVMAFTQNSSILDWAMHNPTNSLLLSSNFTKHSKDVLNLLGTPFCYLYTCTQNSLWQPIDVRLGSKKDEMFVLLSFQQHLGAKKSDVNSKRI